MNILQTLLKDKQKSDIPYLRAGQVVRIHEKIKEGDPSAGSGQVKERIQIFEGLIIAVKHGKGLDGTFIVRKIASGGVGVERIFPLHMPTIEKIEILRKEHVKQGKLYYMREQIGKKIKKRKAKVQNLMFDMGVNKEEAQEPADAQEASEMQENNDDVVKGEQSIKDEKEEISGEQQKDNSTDEGEKR